MEREFTRFLIYTFSPEEKSAMSADLVRNTQDLETLQDRKTQVMADFTAKIKAANAEIFKTARRLANGYEYRDIHCFSVFDQPRKGIKRIVRKDTGEVVGEEAMTMDEMQMVLDLDVQAAQEEIKHDPEPEAATEPPAAEQQPEAPAAANPEPEAATEPPADIPPVDEMPATLSAPFKIEGEGDDWRAEIVIFETAAGFEAEVSIWLRKGDPMAVKTAGIFPSESECRVDAATTLYRQANALYQDAQGATKRIIRSLMAWAQGEINRAHGSATEN